MNKISNGVKKAILLTVVAFALFLVSAKPSNASTWKSPSYPYTADLTAGNCILVNTIAEKDSTHVYTLNPDNTVAINQSYFIRWGRNARCDEIQFHVDHNTPITRLNSWLDSVAYGWYINIGTTHFKGHTISTSRHEWFFVDSNGIHRIPDWLTGLAWGLLIEDRVSIPASHTDKFYELVTIGVPLNFNAGSYAAKIYNIWKEGDRDYSDLPTQLAEELGLISRPNCGSLLDPCVSIFESCQYLSHFPGDPYYNLFDWSWMLTNPGCPLAS